MINRRQFILSLPFIVSGCGGASLATVPSNQAQVGNTQAQSFPAGSFGARGLMGANLPQCNYYEPAKFYRNAAFQGNGLNNSSLPMAVDSQGWPKSGCTFILCANSTGGNGRPGGTYNCQVFLAGTNSSSNFRSCVSLPTSGTIGNGSNGGAAPAFITQISAGQQYPDQPAGAYWSFTIILNGGNQLVYIAFAGAWSNLQVMYPQYSGYNGNTYGPYYPDAWNTPSPQPLWTDEILDMMSEWSVIRAIDFLSISVVGPNDTSTNTWIHGGVLNYYTGFSAYQQGGSGPWNAGAQATLAIPATSFAWAQSGQTYSVKFDGSSGYRIMHTGLSVTSGSATYTVTSADIAAYGSTPTGVSLFPEVPQFLGTTYSGDYVKVPATAAWRTVVFQRSYDDFIDLMNHVAGHANSQLRGIWLTVPHFANFASLGSGGYNATVANLCATNLNSNLKVYLELSNELWNNQFGQYWWFFTVGPTGTIPTYGNFYNPQYGAIWAFSQTVPIWMSAFGQSGTLNSSSRVRPIWGGQTYYGPPSAGPLFAVLTPAVNGTSPWSSPVITVSSQLWALSHTFYLDCGATFTSPSNGFSPGATGCTYSADGNSMNEYDWLALWQSSVTAGAGAWSNIASLASKLGCKVVCYEGWCGTGGGSPQSYAGSSVIAAADAASNNPAIQGVILSMYQGLYSAAGGLLDVACLYRAQDAGADLAFWSMYNSIQPFSATQMSEGVRAVFGAPTN